jgi:replicative superfamily II helicase
MGEHDYESLKTKIEFVMDMGLEVSAKLLNESEEVLEKFKTQDKIRAFLATLKRVDCYKTILRSVGIIDNLVNDAQERKVLLDQDVVLLVNSERERLVSERNLRFQLDNLDPNIINVDDVKNLEELLAVAETHNVDTDYRQEAGVLRDKLNKNIKANEIFKMF